MPFPAHQSHHKPLLSLISLCLLRSLLQERQRQLSHHHHNILHPPSDHFDSFFYIYFDYVCPLWNPMLLISYTGITCITCSHFVLTWIEVIQIYHFFITLSIILFLFPLLISFILFETCGFSNRYSKLISLRRHHFLPIISIAHATLRTMFSLIGGRVEEGSFLLFMLSYFDNLVDFCLILNFFLSFFSTLHSY